ncbi:Fe-S cluster assembly ATPase SufC [Oscillospiraceae bacterium MB08-C2-2]|nr:Fe-S cluster assembly ATPase SufC [Oscillospiraceae bacterium MB08-C2-2]
MNQPLLNVHNLQATLETGKEILRGVDLTIQPGEIHVIMGPNGSGKSTLANTIMGSPAYQVSGGEILLEGEDISQASVDLRAKKGIFMAFQAPEEIDGITVSDFLKTAKTASSEKPLRFFQFQKQLQETMDTLQFDRAYAQRYLNVGFSGGEKKKSEILQLLMLGPKLAILDEVDSGLDVDAVRVVTEGILRYKNENNALLIISHSTRLLDALPVDFVHILSHGKIVTTGDRSLIDEINVNGFARFTQAGTR